MQLVVIPKVEWTTVYMDFSKMRYCKRNGFGQLNTKENWEGPSSSSQLYSKHFEDHCFVTEGVRYSEAMGVPTVKRLKPDTVSTIFPRSINYLESTSSTPTIRPLSEQQKQRSISMLCIYT